MSLLMDIRKTLNGLIDKISGKTLKVDRLEPVLGSPEAEIGSCSNQPSPYLASSYDSGQGYRQLERIARLMTIGFIVSGCLIVSLCLAIYALCPLKQTLPHLIIVGDKPTQIAHIEPIIKHSPSWDLIVEHWCREFVINLETINGIEDEQRHQDTIFLFCSTPIWEDFKRLMHNNDTSPLKDHKEKGITRSVTIDLVTKIRENQWRIEWTSITRESMGGRELHRDKKVSTMEIDFKEEKIPAKYKLINPYGMVVTKYAIGDGRGVS